MLAFESASVNDEERFAESVLTSVLSSGMSSRLFSEIREKRGLVYGVGAQNMMTTDTGMTIFYAGTAPENVDKLMPVLANELKKIATDKVSDAELARAKKQMLTSSRLSKDSLMGRLNGNSGSYNLKEKLPNAKEMTDKINAVTKDEVLQAAQRVFSGDCALSSVGAKGHPDYSKVKASLKM
jgi:predicted Zn-dependent peptidase